MFSGKVSETTLARVDLEMMRGLKLKFLVWILKSSSVDLKYIIKYKKGLCNGGALWIYI